MNSKNSLINHNSKLIKNLLTYSIPLISFFIYFYFNFLEVEDSNVFFNRANYLNSDVLYYYNGQIHFNAQILAKLSSFFATIFSSTHLWLILFNKFLHCLNFTKQDCQTRVLLALRDICMFILYTVDI